LIILLAFIATAVMLVVEVELAWVITNKKAVPFF
jgi:hypothetical protein